MSTTKSLENIIQYYKRWESSIFLFRTFYSLTVFDINQSFYEFDTWVKFFDQGILRTDLKIIIKLIVTRDKDFWMYSSYSLSQVYTFCVHVDYIKGERLIYVQN